MIDDEYFNADKAYESLFGEPPPTNQKPVTGHYDLTDVLYKGFLETLLFPPPSVKLSSWQHFSNMTGGFRPREFTILCGATGVGKTTLLANWSAQLHLQKVPHFVASVETGAYDFIGRVLSSLDQTNLNCGERIGFEQVAALNKKHEALLREPIMCLSRYDNRGKVEALISDIKHAMENHGAKIAMIDNLNFFMDVTTAANSLVEMDRVIHELIIFCKQNDVHVIMVMHPRKVENGRVESEFDIKGSSTAVQEAHNVLLFNRPRQEDIERGMANSSDRELTIAKSRRMGKYTGSRLLFSTVAEVKYLEKKAWML